MAEKDFRVKQGLVVGLDAEINGTGSVKVASGTTAERPASPINGMVRYNTDLDSLEQYVNGEWNKIGNTFIVISDTAPANPEQNDLWWDSQFANLFIYYDGVWIEASYNVPTDLSVSRTATEVIVASSTGDDASIPIATQTNAGVMSAADKERLDNFAVDDLSDATITTIADNDLLSYDGSISQWVNTSDIVVSSAQLSGGTGDQGTLTWDTDEDTLALNEGVNSHRIGQEVLYNVKNQTGSSIAQGTPVMAAGTLGNSGRILIAPMDATDPANSKFYLGVTTETIADGADGKVTHFGKVRGPNLTAYSEGDVLWLSTDTVGAFTVTEPTVGIKIPTAFVISNADPGTMMIRAERSMGLKDLNDVTVQSPTNGQLLIYNETTQMWESSDQTSGVTAEDETRFIAYATALGGW